MDGVPHLTQAPIEENARFEYRFRAADAGTYWYHAPYTLPGQCERGLYGVLIVDEKTPVEVDRDVVLVFDDRPRPVETIATKSNERLRIRLLNASKARMASFRFDRHAIRVMAIDGQPAEPFLAHESHVSLGPGNRIDLFLDATLEPGASASIFLDEAGRETEIARLVYDGAQKRRASPLPDPRPLPANPLPERIDMRNAFRIEAPLHDFTQTGLDECRSVARSIRAAALFRETRTRGCPGIPKSRATPLMPSIFTAIMFACSTISTTAGNRSGSTRSWPARAGRRASRSSRTIRASG